MMRLSFLTLFLIININLLAYNFVRSIEEEINDITARVNPPKNECEDYALLIIYQDVDNLIVKCDNAKPIETVKKDGELWIYVPTRAKTLSIKHPHPKLESTVAFKDFGLKKLEKKKTYSVNLQIPYAIQFEQYGESARLSNISPEDCPGFLILEGNSLNFSLDGNIFLFREGGRHDTYIFEGNGEVRITENSGYRKEYIAKPITVYLNNGYVNVVKWYDGYMKNREYIRPHFEVKTYPLRWYQSEHPDF